MDDRQINEYFKKQAQNSQAGVILAVAGGILALYGLFFSQTATELMFFGGIVLVIVGIFFSIHVKEKAKEEAGQKLARSVLSDVFQAYSYDPKGSIDDYIIRDANMGFPFSYDEIRGSDHVQANYRGIQIEMSDISLVDVTVTTNRKGQTTRREDVRFKGLWLICDFGQTLCADVRISERVNLFHNLFSSDQPSGNEPFDQRFSVYAEYPPDLERVLTPQMMEYILQADNAGGGDLYMRFTKEGKVHIAIHTNRDFFEIPSIQNATAATLRQQFHHELRYVTGLIDILRLAEPADLK